MNKRDEFLDSRLEKFLKYVSKYEEFNSIDVDFGIDHTDSSCVTGEDLELFCDMTFSIAEKTGKAYVDVYQDDFLSVCPYRIAYVKWNDTVMEVFEYTDTHFKSVIVLDEEDVENFEVDDEKISVEFKWKVAE